MVSSSRVRYGWAAAAAIAVHGILFALLEHGPVVRLAAPAVAVRLIERPAPPPMPAAEVPQASANLRPQPPAAVDRHAPRRAASSAAAPAARLPPVQSQPAPASIAEPQSGAHAPAVESTPPVEVVAPETDLAVQCAHRPPPDYPGVARRRGQEGVVELRVELSATGAVSAVTVARASGSSALDRAALTAVRGWSCAPARVGGVAVASTARQRIRFSLR